MGDHRRSHLIGLRATAPGDTYRTHIDCVSDGGALLVGPTLCDAERGVRSLGACVLARAGATARAQQLNHELAKQFPLDTLVQNYWLPSLRAEVEVQKSNPLHAIELLQGAHDYEMADPSMIPTYVAGQAYLLRSKAERLLRNFRKLSTTRDSFAITCGASSTPRPRPHQYRTGRHCQS